MSKAATTARRRDIVASVMLGCSAIALLVPAIVSCVLIALPPATDSASPLDGLGPLVVGAATAIPAGAGAAVLAFIANRLGAGSLSITLIILGGVEAAIPIVAIATMNG